jgi:hypothetical protein
MHRRCRCAVVMATIVVVVGPRHLVAQSAVDPVSETAISGYRGTASTWLAFGAGNSGVRKIWWAERGDKPCQMEVEDGAIVFQQASAARKRLNLCGPDGATERPWSTFGSGRVVEFRDTFNTRYLVRGVAVCSTSANNHRLKGIEILAGGLPSGAAPGTYPEFSHSDVFGRAEQPNCATWQRTVSCRERWVASGRVVFHTSEEITGLALRCREVRY